MNVIEKSDIESTVKYLKKAAVRELEYQQRYALNNVISVLEQALEMHVEDELHPHLYLEIVKAPNTLDCAIEDCCTTECIHVCQGTCPFPRNEKKIQCPIIAKYCGE